MGSALVIGDPESTGELLKTCLSRGGHACETAPAAEAALEILKNSSFDYILIDTTMTGTGGLELAERVKKEQPGAAVIMITDHDEQFPYDMAMAAGADDFLKRPFSGTEVLSRIKIVEKRQDLYHWAVTDELTGFYNRKGFFTLVQHQLKIAIRTKEEMFLLYVDLDNLKTINETYGDKEGDIALVQTANILKENFRGSDILARIGGDEFVVFPVRTTKSHQGLLVARFEKALAKYNEASKKPYTITVSCGIASYDPDNPSSVDELLTEADKAMYRIQAGESD